ncbi:glucosamine-6-phosphate deaminase [Candidatus Saccharibacteria bacterium]|jgi:glucosamine-6-phosphate deaminase|nr:glucosamine-6-phosphate deaminase [Candidatus Saccharibacteria bacterium]
MPEYEPTITVLENSAAVEARAAEIVINQVLWKPDSTLTLPTGGTPVGMYRLLVEAYQNGVVDFSKVTTLNLDEYWKIPKNHPSSYASYMNEIFFKHVNIPEEQRHIPNGEADNPHTEAERYAKLIMQHEIDLGIVSIGPGETCHVAFNERGSEADSRARCVQLDEQTMQANEKYFDNPDDQPDSAITQGIADILSARRILFIATGEHKSWGLYRTLRGEISSEAPASFLRTHPNVHFVLDSAAASLIRI